MRPHDMGTLFDDLADQGGPTLVQLSRPFDIAPDGGVTYRVGDLARLVRDAAGWLAAAGAGRGDRVAIVKDNHWDYDLLACAAVRLGAVPALVDGRLPAAFLEIMLKRLEPALLVSMTGILDDAREAGTDLASMARRTLCLDGRFAGTVPLDEVRGQRPPPPRRRHDDAALVVNQTSGTTGVPKLVVHSTRTIIHRLARFETFRWPGIGYRRGDTVCSASAFTHGRTFCWTATALCLQPRKLLIITDMDPAEAGPVLRAHPPTTVEALPSAFVAWRRLLGAPDNPFRDVRLFLSTYDAVHPPTVRAFLDASRRRFPLWMNGWGQTETGPLTFRFLTRRALASSSRKPTTRDLGMPVPGKTRLRVVDPSTLGAVAPGEPGVVLARTRARCLGYVGEPERWSRKAYGPWWNTGDIGVITRGGRVLLLDREVDMIPGISCLELEDVIEDRVADVAECVVLGVPNRPPLPVLVLRNGQLDTGEWRRAVADLPPLADPVTLAWDEVPRTVTGKIRRRGLRERLLDATDSFGTGRWT